MVDIEKLVALLNSADLPEGEREAWIELVPLLPVDQIEELMVTLETEQSQLTALRQDYLTRAQAVIDESS
ncbi:hypothetical protein A2480_03085 [Candidatus Uhrbacteria bacterium RIFOXYC2_FULL_47_19]|uniref:Uncharacterized protein n=1 Tax=Candidatus Uhrbacteria bacterium RIFOXYC2_FULL_47_19 TaxID=1802424 RepID=A0A1F7WDW2_9BACT|nr:MAG: hypothetical protein A2480_03085 [Candidatus Uhrbacteria bacterium RIFOXYC2_FULL_47_19]HCC22360.1 hypothetical protein [Candidatus Uhrbacteria bacterium]